MDRNDRRKQDRGRCEDVGGPDGLFGEKPQDAADLREVADDSIADERRARGEQVGRGDQREDEKRTNPSSAGRVPQVSIRDAYGERSKREGNQDVRQDGRLPSGVAHHHREDSQE